MESGKEGAVAAEADSAPDEGAEVESGEINSRPQEKFAAEFGGRADGDQRLQFGDGQQRAAMSGLRLQARKSAGIGHRTYALQIFEGTLRRLLALLTAGERFEQRQQLIGTLHGVEVHEAIRVRHG